MTDTRAETNGAYRMRIQHDAVDSRHARETVQDERDEGRRRRDGRRVECFVNRGALKGLPARMGR